MVGQSGLKTLWSQLTWFHILLSTYYLSDGEVNVFSLSLSFMIYRIGIVIVTFVAILRIN